MQAMVRSRSLGYVVTVVLLLVVAASVAAVSNATVAAPTDQVGWADGDADDKPWD